MSTLYGMLFFILVAVVFYVIIKILDLSITYSMHVKDTKEQSEVWDYGTFEDFVSQFNLYNWEIFIGRMLLNTSYNCRVDDFVTRFSGHGMVFGILDYYRYRKYVKNFCKKNKNISKRQTKVWKGKLKVVK